MLRRADDKAEYGYRLTQLLMTHSMQLGLPQQRMVCSDAHNMADAAKRRFWAQRAKPDCALAQHVMMQN